LQGDLDTNPSLLEEELHEITTALLKGELD
jgi:hypothetical protein